MVETTSNMLPLGTKCPDFKLQDVCTGKTVSSHDLKSKKGTCLIFLSATCPYVKHISKKLAEVCKQHQKDINFIGICSNDHREHPGDSPEKLKHDAEAHGYTFPICCDENQHVAKACHAACTPDFFLFDHNHKCVYRGCFDDSTPQNQHPVTGKDLCKAIEHLCAGKPCDTNQRPSVGCSIKGKAKVTS